MSDFQTIRRYLGVSLVVLLSLYAGFGFFGEMRGEYQLRASFQPVDDITLYLNRFHGLRDALPREGVVGYVSDATGPSEGPARRYLAQNAVTPLVIHDTPDLPYVIGNFHSRVPDVVRERNLVMVHNFGNGVMVFRSAVR